jgi:hypothetical protein
LKEAAHEGLLSRVKICTRAPSLTHLFFVDDSIMLMKVSREEALTLNAFFSYMRTV